MCSEQMLIAAHLKRLLPAFVLIFRYPSVKTQVTVLSLNRSSEAPVSFKKLLPLRFTMKEAGCACQVQAFELLAGD